ncbi:MAG: LPS export ABC transporter periplasmic protein LptC [Treponema sp.]|nr:LPS export ABC transporter periplasmic protein LptC [Treponema sp.]
MKRNFHFPAGTFILLVFGACSFDYGQDSKDGGEFPDVVMENVEYVRVRDGNPVVRFAAEEAERYEDRHIMELKYFSFQQFNTASDEVNATGSAGSASVELESGNIELKNGVRIEVDSEDIVIETAMLNWKDKERRLDTGEWEPVEILRNDGTKFTGWGFSADARRRTWAFAGGVQGAYVDDDDKEEEPVDEGEIDEILTEAGESWFLETQDDEPEGAEVFEDSAK